MNTLSKLQQASASDTKSIDFRGVPLRICRMGAQDGIALHKLTPQAPFDAADLVAFHAFVLSKSLVGDDGQLDSDSDEARAELAKLPLAHLVELSAECLLFSGMSDAKKNETGPTLSDSPSDSALPSESNTPTDSP